MPHRSLRVAAVLSLIAVLTLGGAIAQAARPNTGCQLYPGDTTVVWNPRDFVTPPVTLALLWYAGGIQIDSGDVAITRRVHRSYSTPTPITADEFGFRFLDSGGGILGLGGGNCLP